MVFIDQLNDNVDKKELKSIQVGDGMEINKKDVIKLLETIALHLEILGENPFRISAYRRAAQAIERDERSLKEIDTFTTIKGIGEGTNAVIMEFIQKKRSTVLAELEEEVPKSLFDLLKVPGLGGKKISTLYRELGITDFPSLREACLSGEVEKLPGFGKKTVENILNALKENEQQPESFPIALMLSVAEKIEQQLKNIQSIQRFSRAGSLRRLEEMIKDLDFVLETTDPKEARIAIQQMEHVKKVVQSGDTKISLLYEDEYDIPIDFRLVSSEQYASTLHHFTGSKEHNVALRQLAKKRGEKINEYGVSQVKTGKVQTFQTEEELFSHFNLPFIPPELRKDGKELETYQADFLYIDIHDIRGDLHMHTTWSDGAESIEEMVTYAISLGYEYLAITDHSRFLRIANGLNESRLRKQREEIQSIQEKYPEIKIFAGIEMDILPDGTLDFSNDFLKELDFVIAAIHSAFNQSEKEIMHRLMTAIENPYVHMIAHPTGRLIGKRKGYAVDLDKLFKRAEETRTVLEINASPQRFDLSAEMIQKALNYDVLFSINTDAHRTSMLHLMEYGVKVSRKGQLPRERVINTWTIDQLEKFLIEKRL